MRRLGRVGRQAHRDDLGVGEADRGDRADGRRRASCPAMISATISPCAMARWASIGSPVTSPTAQTLRIEVAQRSSMRTNGPAMVEVEPFETEPGGARAPPDRDQNLVGGDRRLVAVAAGDAERALAETERPRAGMISMPRSAARRATGWVSSSS